MSNEKNARRSLALVRTQTMERAQGNAIPIEFRSLSIHVTETHLSNKKGAPINASKGKDLKEDAFAAETDFFTSVKYHKLSPAEISLSFNSDETKGLSHDEAERRLKANGLNKLDMRKPNYVKKVLGYIFGGFCSILWIGAFTFLLCWQPPLSDPPNITNFALAMLIIFVIFLQATFSAFQDFSTAKVMSSILDMIPAECHVFRGGNLVKIPASHLVVGDRVHLSLGNKVPADMRLLQATNDTRLDRSVLTGESDAIEATTDATDDNFLESKNVAFMGTHIVQGSCVGIVVLKGNDTLMGRINKLTSGRKPKKTIIQKEISRFIFIIVAMTLILISIITIVWLAWIRRVYPNFMSTATLLVTLMGCVVAFIPEGMPVCVSLTLLMIARRMRESNILPKALSTVETLGCVNVICSDKTGDAASLPDGTMAPIHERKILGDATDSALLRFSAQDPSLNAVADCFERKLEIPFNSRNKWMMTAYQGTAQKPQVIKTLFGANLLNATVTNPNEKEDMLVFVKGAPDVLLPYCTSFVSATARNGPQPLTSDWKAELSRIQHAWSRRGQRVLMLCKGRYTPYLAERQGSQAGSSSKNATQEELARQGLQELCIIGLVGIMDPPRPEIKDTIQACRRAGSRFFMVTGDFGVTAAAIAKQIGLFSSEYEPHTYDHIMDPSLAKKEHDSEPSEGSHGGSTLDLGEVEPGRPRYNEGTSLVLTGSDLAKMSPGEWDLVCAYEEIVFARTSPEQKLRIVTEFQNREGVVAVTGDGVNDAPALKAADVGVAVVSGSDVAIEAADLILLGGFDSIPAAIRFGRIAFQNLQKVIGYLLPAGSWSEVWPVLINTFLGTPLSLSSFLMVIVCCFTDAFPCTALVMEQEEFDLLSMRPRNAKKDHLITGKIYGQSYFFIGTMMTFFCNMFFFLYLKEYTGLGFQDLVFTFGEIPVEKLKDGITLEQFNTTYVYTGQCITFVTLVIVQWGNILSVRNRRLQTQSASFLVAVLVTETPGIQQVMLTNSVPIKYWLLPLPCAVFIIAADEIRKLIVRVFPQSIIAKVA
ncbi:hypothetical protein BGW38_008450, partial [Lunasporangiospora selenospora]